MTDAIVVAFLVLVAVMVYRGPGAAGLLRRIEDQAVDLSRLREMSVGLAAAAEDDHRTIGILKAEAERDRQRAQAVVQAMGDAVMATRRDAGLDRPAFLPDAVTGLRPGMKGGLN